MKIMCKYMTAQFFEESPVHSKWCLCIYWDNYTQTRIKMFENVCQYWRKHLAATTSQQQGMQTDNLVIQNVSSVIFAAISGKDYLFIMSCIWRHNLQLGLLGPNNKWSSTGKILFELTVFTKGICKLSALTFL